MKLSGKHDAQIRIGVIRFPVVDIRTLGIEVTNVNEVAVLRLLNFALFPLISLRIYQCISSVYYPAEMICTRKWQVVSSFPLLLHFQSCMMIETLSVTKEREVTLFLHSASIFNLAQEKSRMQIKYLELTGHFNPPAKHLTDFINIIF